MNQFLSWWKHMRWLRAHCWWNNNLTAHQDQLLFIIVDIPMFRVLFAFKPARKPNFHGLNPLRNCPDDLTQKVAHQEKTKMFAIWAFLSQWVCLPESRYPIFLVHHHLPHWRAGFGYPLLGQTKKYHVVPYLHCFCVYIHDISPTISPCPSTVVFQPRHHWEKHGFASYGDLIARSLESGFEWCPNPLRITGKYMGVILDLMGNDSWQLAYLYWPSGGKQLHQLGFMVI